MSGLISNGSFVLGDPNTRDLYLGKGLKDGFEGEKYYIATDETVLWEGEADKTQFPISLSEPISSFNTVKFYFRTWNTGTYKNFCVSEKPTNDPHYTLDSFYHNTGNDICYSMLNELAADDTNKTLNYEFGAFNAWNTTSINYGGNSEFALYKVVGVNRKREED